MPPFPERESSLLAKLRKTAPKAAKIHDKALPPVDNIQEPPTIAVAQEPENILPISSSEVCPVRARCCVCACLCGNNQDTCS